MLRILFLAFLSFLVVDVYGQSMTKMNWKQKRNYAIELFEKGDYSRAGQYFRSAYKSKPALEELTYKAGKCYMLSRNYKLAVGAYEPIKDNDREFKDAGLLYAIALKHSGEYEEAIIELNEQLVRLGDEPNTLKYEIEDEIKGCELALQNEDAIDSSIKIKHLGKRVNSGSPQFCPRFISDDEIIYSSINVNGFAKIYSSKKEDEGWTKGELFPIQDIALPHYGNGTFSNDKKTFYFTQCELNSLQLPVCAIYASELRSDIYSQPIKLSETINEFEANTTHPFLYSDGNIDILLFSSDRSGGMGGQDIWFTMKKTGETFTEFSAPINLGAVINTPKDEITPFYDNKSGTLYFSSNGLVSIGGFDIFKSEGFRTKWNSPNNIGMPLNSSADDFFYSFNSGGNKLFISNRKVPPNKVSTSDDDIFLIESPKSVNILVAGQIKDRLSEEGLDDATVKLYQLNKEGDISLLKSTESKDGAYTFELNPDKEYRIEATHLGYKSAFFDMATYKIKSSVKIDQDVPLEIDSATIALLRPKMTETEVAAILPDNGNAENSSSEINMEISELTSVETPSTAIETENAITDTSTPDISLPDPKLVMPDPTYEEREKVDLPKVEVETPVVETPVVKTPVVETPVVEAPVVEAPVVETPVVETPVVETPVVETPVVETPVVEAPVVEAPVVETPVVKTPVVETPVVETPVVKTPVVETPVVETPVVKTPVVETPVVETPVVEAPVVEAPVVEAPVVEAPVVEAPVVETPVVEAPVVKTPVVEAPVVEAPVVEAPVVEYETRETTTPTTIVETPSVTTPSTVTMVETGASGVFTPNSSAISTPSVINSTPTYYPESTTSTYTTIVSSGPNMNQYFSGPVDGRIYDYPGNAKANIGSQRISSDRYITDSDARYLIESSGTTTDQFASASSTNSPYPYTSPIYSYDSGTSSTEVISSEPIVSTPNVVTSTPIYETIVETTTPIVAESSVMQREYKIQMAAIPEYNPSRYTKVEEIGFLVVLEEITTRNGSLQRVLIDGYSDPSEAYDALKQIQGAGFPRAFMIRYDNGVRIPHTMRR